ncbi:MAG: nucleotidyltransferase family protein, partial [Myxococcota bacterium]
MTPRLYTGQGSGRGSGPIDGERGSAHPLRSLAALVSHLCRPGRARDGAPWSGDCAALPDALVRRHFLTPLAYRAGVSRFRSDFVASSLLAEIRAQTLAEVLAALAESAIPVILLKGIAYARTLYSEPAERPMSDIDLLVPPGAHRRAGEILRRLGYWVAGSNQQRSPLHHAVCYKRRSAAIDLHRSMVQPWRSRIDIAGLWQRSRPAPDRSEPCRRLERVDEVVLHLAHIARHELHVPIINYVDAARMLTGGRPRPSDPGARSAQPSWRSAADGALVAAVRRPNDFARVYDLAERVLPADVLATPAVPENEARK